MLSSCIPSCQGAEKLRGDVKMVDILLLSLSEEESKRSRLEKNFCLDVHQVYRYALGYLVSSV